MDTDYSGRNKFKWRPDVGDVGIVGGQAPDPLNNTNTGGFNHHFLLWMPYLEGNSAWCIDGNGGRAGEPGMADRTVIEKRNGKEVPLGGRNCRAHRTFQEIKALYTFDLGGFS